VGWTLASGREGRAFLYANVDEPEYSVTLSFGGQRAHLGLRVVRIADPYP